MTINDVRNAVHTALNSAFPDIPVIGEEIRQDPIPPCFFVKLHESGHIQELGRRFYRYHPFDVRYFAPDGNNDAMYDMAERLTEALQWIQAAGRPVRGTGMRFEIVDGVLHFFVEYHFHVWAPKQDGPAMQTLNFKEGVK